MGLKEKILFMAYEEYLTPEEISEALGQDLSYVTEVLHQTQ